MTHPDLSLDLSMFQDATASKTLIDGERLRQLFDRNRPKLLELRDRILSRNRKTPRVRMEEYMALQAPLVRDAIASLMHQRRWQYVSLSEFLETIDALTDRLVHDLARDRSSRLCFVVDDFAKSSFWVLALIVNSAESRDVAGFRSVSSRMCVAVDQDGAMGGIASAFLYLPRNTTLIFVDDASYSGEQISYNMRFAVRAWQATHSREKPKCMVAVPYMSLSSVRLLRMTSKDIINVMTFRGLFERRSVVSTLKHDLYLERRSFMFADYQSLVFDFLHIEPCNALIFFEHKIADGLSIPERWLKAGPCVSTDVKHAFRVRDDKVTELLRHARIALKASKDEYTTSAFAALPGAVHKLASRYVVTMLQSAQFRAAFMERVVVDQGKKRPLFYPLLDPESCDMKYRRHMDRLMRTSSAQSYVPECRKPPYKRESFQRRVALPP
jgi:hypothetical protein